MCVNVRMNATSVCLKSVMTTRPFWNWRLQNTKYSHFSICSKPLCVLALLILQILFGLPKFFTHLIVLPNSLVDKTWWCSAVAMSLKKITIKMYWLTICQRKPDLPATKTNISFPKNHTRINLHSPFDL